MFNDKGYSFCLSLFLVHGIKLGDENHITPLALKTTFRIYDT